MKLTNFKGAIVSTLIGVGITAGTSIYQAMQSGPVNWKAIGASAVMGIILAFTDILKELQKNQQN